VCGGEHCAARALVATSQCMLPCCQPLLHTRLLHERFGCRIGHLCAHLRAGCSAQGASDSPTHMKQTQDPTREQTRATRAREADLIACFHENILTEPSVDGRRAIMPELHLLQLAEGSERRDDLQLDHAPAAIKRSLGQLGGSAGHRHMRVSPVTSGCACDMR